MSTKVEFTPDMDQVIIDQVNAKHPLAWALVAKKVGVSTEVLLNRRRKLGIKRKRASQNWFKWTAEHEKIILQAEGKPDTNWVEIAKRIGVGDNALRNKRKELGLQMRAKFEWTPEAEAIVRASMKKDSLKVMAWKIGTSIGVVQYKRQDLEKRDKNTP